VPVDRRIILARAAQRDLEEIERYIGKVASPYRARAYIRRILDFVGRFDYFPERGTLRSDIRPGLRVLGFERRVSIAFMVRESEIVIIRILYGGRQIDPSD
jgi:plasmid stabilization system protein ParE